MKNLKFQTRLIIGFSIILFFSFIIGILAILQIQNISSDMELMYKHPLTVSNSVRDINVNINAIHRSMKDIALAENSEQFDKYVHLVNYYDSLIYAAFDIVRKRFLGDQNIVENTYKAYIDWEIIRNKVIELKKAGNEIEAAKITKGKGALHVELLFDKTKILTDYAQNKANEFYQNTVQVEKKSVVLLLFSISILLILSIIISLAIAKSISKPIRKFIAEINLIYKKRYLPENKFYKKSEQEILSNTVWEMKMVYEKLENFNQELDQEVKTRTKELSKSEKKLLIQNEEYLSLAEEYKAQNEELINAKERAEESDRLKSAFLANMSHEIRTPMNSILGFSDLLKKDDLSLEKKEMYIDLIDSGGKRLMTIISDIVEISKINANQLSLNYKGCNLNKLIDNLFSQFSNFRANKSVSLKTNKGLTDYESFIKTDETRLTQILSNMIENAQKFTKEGVIEFGYTLNGKVLQFYVKDTGIGIDTKDQKFVFERFRQIDNNYTGAGSGTGLGLSIAKGLVELLGGEIWVESEINKGTTFYFTTPYNPDEQKVKKVDVEKDVIKSNTEDTILIVEDELSNYVYMAELLKDHNYNVIHAKNGKEAVEMVSKFNSIDLVMMDIKMPVMNGLEATREIRKTNKNIPIIAQTAYAMAEDKIKAKEAECSDYLVKPISEEMLFNIINKYIKTGADKNRKSTDALL